MMKFLRSQSQTVLVVVLAVIGLGFVFYGNAGNLLTSTGAHTSNDYGRIDGEDLTVAELSDAVRTTRDTLIINGQSQALQQPGAAAQIAELAWRQLLMMREAERLHIVVTDRELVDFIQKQPLFQKNGVYDPGTYESRMKDLQALLRVPSDGTVDAVANTKTIFYNVLRSEMTVDAATKALFAGVRSSSGDVTAEYAKYYGPATISFVTLDPKTYIATAQVTPAQIEAEYKAHPENPDYRTQEKRKVDYVLFLLNPEQQKLPAAQKNAAKEALGQKALDFALALQPDPSANAQTPETPADFMTEAKKRALSPGTTDFFTADLPPSGLPPSPAFNSAAFALTKDNPVSKVIELENGVAVLHLDEIQASDLRPLDEVKSSITTHLQQSNGTDAERTAALQAAIKLKQAGTHGADFRTTASALGLKVESIPAFVPMKTPPSDQRLQSLAVAVISLKPGDVSDPIPSQVDNTTTIVHLDRRDTADPSGLTAFEARFRQSQDEQLRRDVYADWSNWMSKQPGTHRPPELDAYGSVE